jgi:hypothetical protein
MDPEFFNKEAVRISDLMKNSPPLSSFVRDGYRVVYENTKVISREEGIESNLPFFLQASDIKTPFIMEERMSCVSGEDWERYPKGRINRGEVLIEVKGMAEKVAIVPQSFPTRTLVTGTCFKLTPLKSVYGPLLVAFLTSRPGQVLKNRAKTNLLVSFVSKNDLYSLPVPSFSDALVARIATLFSKAESEHYKALNCANLSEGKINALLDLADWRVPAPLTYECSIKSVFESGRMDAEFFRTKFDALQHKLAEKSDLVSLGDIALVTNGKTVPYDEDGTVPIVRSGDLSDISSHENLLRAKSSEDIFYLKKGDVLISSIGFGSIGKVQVFDLDIPCGAVSEVTVIRTDKVNPYFLCSYLRSIAGQLQFERWTTGATGQLHLYPRDVRLMFVPLVSSAVQLEIESLFKNATESRANSKSLLERAKRAVEIAIEESEETALAYLDGKHYLADELLPKLFSPNRHYIDLATVQRTIEAEALVYEPTTINRYLHEWTREGRIRDAGRGWYSNLPHAFQPVLETPPLPELEKLLRKHFPLLEFTVWSTRQLTTFFHHYAARHATFLMVDRDAMDTVADVLTKAGHHVVIHPLGDAAKNFALTQDETIILRPRLSSDHKETYAPIEQMLVDLHHEIQKLGLFDLAEFQSIIENLANRYRLNVPALKRYAERRKTDSTELLKLGGII